MAPLEQKDAQYLEKEKEKEKEKRKGCTVLGVQNFTPFGVQKDAQYLEKEKEKEKTGRR